MRNRPKIPENKNEGIFSCMVVCLGVGVGELNASVVGNIELCTFRLIKRICKYIHNF